MPKEAGMNTRRFLFVILFLFVFAAFPYPSFANHQNPTIFVISVVGRCLDILKSEKNKDIQREKILDLMRIYFDFPGIVETLLIDLKVSDRDKMTFTNFFPLLLEMRYSTFVRSPDSIRVEYVSHEFSADGLEAIVFTNTKILSREIALHYKLRHVDGEWKIYDIAVADVSLIGNYKAQIRKIFKSKSFADFIYEIEKIIGKKYSSHKDELKNRAIPLFYL